MPDPVTIPICTEQVSPAEEAGYGRGILLLSNAELFPSSALSVAIFGALNDHNGPDIGPLS